MRDPSSQFNVLSRLASSRALVALAVLLGGLLSAGAIVVTSLQAAPPAAQTAAEAIVDQELWRALHQAPDHRGPFVVTLAHPGEQDPDALIAAQIGLENVLEVMRDLGAVDGFQALYGAKTIVVSGSIDAVLYLRQLPNVARIRLPQAGESWPAGFDVNVPDGTGVITGRVTAAAGGAPLPGIEVRVYRQFDPVSWVVAGTTSSDANGDYSFTGLEGGIYRARFRDPNSFYVTEYFNNQFSFAFANGFYVIDGQTTSNINAALENGGYVTGKVTQQGGGNVKDITVTAWRSTGGGWQTFGSDLTDNKGDYSIGGLISGTYRLQFSDVFQRFVTEYYDNKGDLASADNISVSSGQTTSGINAEMGPYGSLSGRVTGPQGAIGVGGIDIVVYEQDVLGYWDFASVAETDGDGNYHAFGLLTKDYRVEFSDRLGFFVTEYYNNQPDVDSGTSVSVTLGLETTGIDASLSPPVITQTYPVAADWNLISFPLHLPDTETGAAFGSVAGSYEAVWAYDSCVTPSTPWKAFDPAAPPIANTLKNVDVKHGMWLQMTSPMTLTITGTQAFRTTFNLCAGWNLISWPSTTTLPVADGLAQISGKYNIVWAYDAADSLDPWKKYNPTAIFGNDLTSLQPGFGYWVRMTAPGTLTVANR